MNDSFCTDSSPSLILMIKSWTQYFIRWQTADCNHSDISLKAQTSLLTENVIINMFSFQWGIWTLNQSKKRKKGHRMQCVSSVNAVIMNLFYELRTVEENVLKTHFNMLQQHFHVVVSTFPYKKLGILQIDFY